MGGAAMIFSRPEVESIVESTGFQGIMVEKALHLLTLLNGF
jgi:hypothetical protein